jgi:hypothetical protein
LMPLDGFRTVLGSGNRRERNTLGMTDLREEFRKCGGECGLIRHLGQNETFDEWIYKISAVRYFSVMLFKDRWVFRGYDGCDRPWREDGCNVDELCALILAKQIEEQY